MKLELFRFGRGKEVKAPGDIPPGVAVAENISEISPKPVSPIEFFPDSKSEISEKIPPKTDEDSSVLETPEVPVSPVVEEINLEKVTDAIPSPDRSKKDFQDGTVPENFETWIDQTGRQVIIASVDAKTDKIAYFDTSGEIGEEPTRGSLKTFLSLFHYDSDHDLSDLSGNVVQETPEEEPREILVGRRRQKGKKEAALKADPLPNTQEQPFDASFDDLEIPEPSAKKEGSSTIETEAGELLTAKEGETENGDGIIDADFEPKESASRDLVPTRDILAREIAEARTKFAYADLEHNKAWKSIALAIPGLKNSKGLIESSDLVHWRTEYQRKLQGLHGSEIERLKNSGLSGKKLEHEVEKVIRYFKCDEAISLYEARTEARKERQGWGGKALNAFENLGKSYNKLPLKYKIGIAAGAVGLAAVTGGIAGGGAFAGGALLARRFVAAAGSSVAMEGLIKKIGEKMGEREAKKSIAKNIEKLGIDETGTSESFERLSALLDTEIREVDKKLKKRKQTGIWQKTAALGIGLGGTFGLGTLLSGHAEAATVTEKIPVPLNVTETPTPAAHEAALPAAFAEPQQAADLKAAQEYVNTTPAEQAEIRGVTGMSDEKLRALTAEGKAPTEALSSPENVSDASNAPTETSAEKAIPETVSPTQTIETLRADHTTTVSDGRSGLWGILDSRLPKDMPSAERVKVISSLENAIAGRLHGMSPEQLRAVGFSSGNVNVIQAGDTLKFGEVLSVDETKAILEGRVVLPVDVEAPTVEAPVATLDGEASAFPEAQASVGEQAPTDPQASAPEVTPVETPKEAVPAPEPGPETVETIPEPAVEKIGTELPLKDELKSFFQEHPDRYQIYVRNLGLLRQSIFETPEAKGFQGYNLQAIQNSLDKTLAAQVLSDNHMIEKNPSYLYDKAANSLHVSQMERLDLLSEAAEKSFGEAGQPKVTETVGEYTQRMVYLLIKKKMENPSFKFKF